ncbi:MAG: FtsQ-type POTRA domain-containing protein [Verrucomicrobiales bacterium]|nr:FtsQ-type POTRA domain-containing protein [Verrucomicrobiales bacterium]
MIFRSSSKKARRKKAAPFDLSRKRVVESLHSMDTMESILALEARTDAPKKRTLRRSRWGLRLLRTAAIGVSILSLMAFAHWSYQRAFIENPDFVLQKVELAIPDDLSGNRVLEVADVEQGMNMMSIDLDGMRDRLAAMPMVSEVSVSRKFPDKLLIVVKESRPVAWMACAAQGIEPFDAESGWLLDEHGVLVKCAEVTPRLTALPVISVKEVFVSKVGAMVDSAVVQAALQLMDTSRLALQGQGLEVLEVVADNSYSMRAVYNNRMEVVFGLSDLDEALMDLQTILERTRADGKLLATVNLRVRRNIPVTFYSPPVARPVDLDDEPSAGEDKKSG